MGRDSRRVVLVCSSCCREMRTKPSRVGFIAGMCRECRGDDIPDESLEVYEELRSPAEDHDNTYNGGCEFELDDGSTDFD